METSNQVIDNSLEITKLNKRISEFLAQLEKTTNFYDKEDEIQKYIKKIKKIEEILKNGNYDHKDFEFKEIKEKCINGIKEISEKYIEKLKNKNNNPDIVSRYKICIDALKNGNNNPDIVFKHKICIDVLKDIAVDSEIEDGQKCIKAIIEILENDKIDQDTSSYCIYTLQNICENHKSQEIKEKCINGIKEISKKYIKKLNDGNNNLDIVSECKYCIYTLGYIAADSKIEEGRKCIEAIIEISKNDKIDLSILSYCMYTLKNICEKSEDLKIKEECIDALKNIYKKYENFENFESKEIKEQCIEGIKKILENEKDDIEVAHKCYRILIDNKYCRMLIDNTYGLSQFNEIKKIYLKTIKEISKNEKQSYYIHNIQNFYEKSKNLKEKKECIDALQNFCGKYTNSKGKKECIDAIEKIYEKSEVSEIKEECIDAFENIYEKYKNYKDLESKEIKEQCIGKIKKIFENKKNDLKVLNKCFYIFECKIDISEYLKEKNTTLINLYSKKINEISQNNKKQEQEYTKSKRSSPKSLFNNQYNNKFVNKQRKTKQQKAEGNAMVL